MKRYFQFSIATLCLALAVLIGFHVAHSDAVATIVTAPVGNTIAITNDNVVTPEGDVWFYHEPTANWINRGSLPVPVDQVQFISGDAENVTMVDKSGNFWDHGPAAWVNQGHPPIPVPTEASTIGGVKGKYK